MTHPQPDAAAPRPRLVAVGGWIASGKSTAARVVAQALGAELLVADELRAKAANDGNGEARLPGFSENLYPELLARADELLAAGRSVVLDATFRRRTWRAAARELAARRGARFLFVECRSPREACLTRLTRRKNPDGWVALFDHFVAHEWEPVTELSGTECLVLETDRLKADTLSELRSRIG
jgi:predicted kinase